MTAADLLRLPPGTRYHLPDISQDLPHGYNPFADQALRSAIGWARPMMRACLGRSLAELIITEMVDWPCHVYPHADLAKMDMLLRWALAAIAIDDGFTRTRLTNDPEAIRRRVSACIAVVEGERPPDGEQDRVMLWQSIEADAAVMPRPWGARLRRRWIDVLSMAVTEAEHRITGVFPAWPEYLAFRRVNLYGFQVMIHAELAAGVDMSDTMARHGEWVALERVAVDHVMFTNDLYSLPKEACIGEFANTFWLLRRDGATVQEAVDRIAELVVAQQDEFLRRRAEILSGPWGARPEIRRYLDALSHTLGGNLRYHKSSTRYHGPAHDGTPVGAGTVVIGERCHAFQPDVSA